MSVGNCFWWGLILVGIYWDNLYYYKGLEIICLKGYFWLRIKYYGWILFLEFGLIDNFVISYVENNLI